MSEHTHEWMKVNEQGLIGGYFPVGWECVACGEWRGNGTDAWELTKSGAQSSKQKLVGPHGGWIQTDTGKKCKAQIYDATTKELTYVEG